MFLEVAPEVKRGLHSGAGRCAARVLPWPGGRPVLAFPEGSVPPALHRGWLESVPTAPRGPAAVCPHRVSFCAQRGVGDVTRKSGSAPPPCFRASFRRRRDACAVRACTARPPVERMSLRGSVRCVCASGVAACVPGFCVMCVHARLPARSSAVLPGGPHAPPSSPSCPVQPCRAADGLGRG